MIRDDFTDTVSELFAPGTIAELLVLFVCLIAPAAILFLMGE